MKKPLSPVDSAQVLRLGVSPKTAPEPESTAPKILDDAGVATATLKELRAAYQELRTVHQNHRCEDLIGARTKARLLAVKEDNRKTGGHRPLGFIADAETHKLAPDAGERKIMKIAKQQRDEGESLRKIATYLEDQGFKSRKKTKFAAAQIKRLVARADAFSDETSSPSHTNPLPPRSKD